METAQGLPDLSAARVGDQFKLRGETFEVAAVRPFEIYDLHCGSTGEQIENARIVKNCIGTFILTSEPKPDAAVAVS